MMGWNEAPSEHAFWYNRGREMSAPALREQPGACPTRLERAEMAKRNRKSPEERFWAKVDKNGPIPEKRPDLGPCWIWTGSSNGTYGRFYLDGRSQPAHRVAYGLVVAPIPPGLQGDHLCFVPLCVNPSHIEPVTPQVNVLRGDTVPAHRAAVTHCPQGHAYDEANTYFNIRGSRMCRACSAAYARRKRRADSAARRAAQ